MPAPGSIGALAGWIRTGSALAELADTAPTSSRQAPARKSKRMVVMQFSFVGIAQAAATVRAKTQPRVPNSPRFANAVA